MKPKQEPISNLKSGIQKTSDVNDPEEISPVKKSIKKWKSKSKQSRSGRDTSSKSKQEKEFGPYLEHPLMKGANPEQMH